MNSEFKVSAREFRPQKFSEVISQEFATRTLKNAIKNNKIAHAYLFCGPRGTGKTTLARIFAKAMNCSNQTDGEPCNKCDSCIEITSGGHPDVFELDAASNRGIDDVRAIQDAAKFYPIKGKFKFFIIDEVHMLTIQAFNALLKILEEPPAYLIFILATTNPEKIPQTITSRCQRFLLSRFKINEIISKLKDVAKQRKIKIDDESLFEIAKLGDGALRDALGIFDMVISFSETEIKIKNLKEFLNLPDKEIYFKITEFVKSNDTLELLNLFNNLVDKGFDLQTFYNGITEHLRNILIIKSTGNEELLNETDVIKSEYKKHSESFTSEEILRLLNLLFESEQKFKYSFNQKIFMESLLQEMVKLNAETVNFDKLITELNEFKKKTLNPEITDIDEIVKKVTPKKDILIEKLKDLFDIEEHIN